MPIKNGRWVSRDVIYAEEQEAKRLAADKAIMPAPAPEPDKALKVRRPRKAAEAAIAAVTGTQVSITSEEDSDVQ